MQWIKAAAITIMIMICGLAAAKPQFQLPLACKLGKDCWIVNYFDHDGSAKTKDYRCGNLTYDGHRGTDFAVVDDLAMEQGAVVVAAAAGTVRLTHDGEADRFTSSDNTNVDRVQKQCGNRVAIDHGDDWLSDYCHLRRGSILVKEGDVVKPGQPIAKIGLSGKTEFPHVHFAVYHKQNLIDPFTGNDNSMECKSGDGGLWDDSLLSDLAYQPTQIIDVGVSNSVPIYHDVLRGWHDETVLPATIPVLSAWAVILGIHTGDTVTVSMVNPNGQEIFNHRDIITRDRARYFVYTGLRRRLDLLETGVYQAKVTVKVKKTGALLEKLFEVRIGSARE